MARLAQIRFVLERYEVTPDSIRQLGHTADRIAQQAALRIYGRDVEIDVLLEEGSLLAKIGVIGGLILGSYHAVAEYPDFLHGVAILSSQAKEFSNEFMDKFFVESGTSTTDLKKITVSSPTPEKIYALVKKLEKLDEQAANFKPDGIINDLAKAGQNLKSLKRDLSEAEAEHLTTVLKFPHLPSVSHWPKESPKGLSGAPVEKKELKSKKTGKERLRYHNHFSTKRGP